MKGDTVMSESTLIRKIQVECPICDKIHEIEERSRIDKTIIKGEEVAYEETYYFCVNSDEDESEFVTGKMLNDNLFNARNMYRKAHNQLISDDIVTIIEKHGVFQAYPGKLLDRVKHL